MFSETYNCTLTKLKQKVNQFQYELYEIAFSNVQVVYRHTVLTALACSTKITLTVHNDKTVSS